MPDNIKYIQTYGRAFRQSQEGLEAARQAWLRYSKNNPKGLTLADVYAAGFHTGAVYGSIGLDVGRQPDCSATVLHLAPKDKAVPLEPTENALKRALGWLWLKSAFFKDK